jgi:sterol desaturase/sphingolipid hydroxylase (fatty acid hydroxylase superfamily)
LKALDFIAGLFDLKTALIVAVIFIPLERLLPLKRSQPVNRAGWSNDAVFLIVNGALVRLGLILVAAAIFRFRGAMVPAGVLSAVGGQPLWLQAIEVFVLADLGFYAAHRLFHAVPFLWRFHAIHHSIEELDWLAAFRVHPLDQLTVTIASLFPILAFGFSDWAIAFHAAAYRWHSLLLHSNVRLPLGRLGLVIATPEFHHWHHSRDQASWDKNFAGQISLFDVIFGTAYLPRGEHETTYGIDDATPRSYVDQLCHPFRKPAAGASSAEALESQG